MSIYITGSYRNHISFPKTAALDLDRMTVTCWMHIRHTYLNETAETAYFFSKLWYFGFTSSEAAPYQVLFFFPWSTTAGKWVSPINTVTHFQNYFMAVTYDSTSINNDPILYVNAAPVEMTEVTAPSGTAVSSVNYALTIGDTYGNASDCRIYNRILSETEIATLYKSKLQKAVLNGLNVWAPLNSAKGVVDFEGTNLTADNTVQDVIGGNIGVPHAFPDGFVRGIGNTFQIFGGDHGE